MRHLDRIHFQGACDRLRCAKQYNHSHPEKGQLKPENARYRRRKPSFYVEGGGRFSNIMTNLELIQRLMQLPLDAIISCEDDELYAIKNDEVATVVSAYKPTSEDFDAQGNLI